MAYIESDVSLPLHNKTKQAARLLRTQRSRIVGCLHCLWAWALTNTPDGDLTGFDHAILAEEADWEGDPDELIMALLTCGRAGKHGFLERTSDGRLLIHDWSDYAGKLIDKRNNDAYQKWLKRNNIPDTQANHQAWLTKSDPEPAPVSAPIPAKTALAARPKNVPRTSNGHRTDVPIMSVGCPPDGATKLSVAEHNLANRSSSVANPQAREGHPVDIPGALQTENETTATAPMDKSKEIPDERMPLPDEPPGVYVRRVLPLCPPTWRKLVESRWKALYEAGKGGSEWGFKAKILRDLVTGAEPSPEDSTESPPPPPRLVRSAIPVPPDWLPGVDTGTAHGLARNAHLRLKQTIPDIQPLDDRVRDEARRLYEESKKIAETPKTGSLREADGPKSFSNIAARVLPNRKIGPDYPPVEETA